MQRTSLTSDPDDVLKPCIEKELAAFVAAILGPSTPAYTIDGPDAIGRFVEALDTEISRLRALVLRKKI